MIEVLKIIKPGIRQETLCRPVDQHATPQFLFEKQFPQQGITVSLRTLCIGTDTDTIYEWVNKEFARSSWQKNDGPARQLRETYEMILCSDFAQSFVALINNDVICQLDIFHAPQHDVSFLYNAVQGDYNINVIMSPEHKDNTKLSVCILETFLDYFFRCDGIKRIIADPESDDEAANELMISLGFQFHAKTYMSYRSAHLYICPKSKGNDFNKSVSQ